MTDIEINKNTKLENIINIAKNIELNENDIELYGKYKAKINLDVLNKNNNEGKLILVTAISPTPLGEGKTTVSISIADGLKSIGKNSILTLREPSLGPVFGVKGGATGGGYSQVAPMEDINLHFTGDIHAITSANNLLASIIDNHIYFGNDLGFREITFKRCLDLNDRVLRKIEIGLSSEENMKSRIDGFDITVASEIMAILCLSTDLIDLKSRLGNIIVGYNNNDEPIYVKDLHAEGSMAVLLKDAIKPNLVQTLEHTPAIIHGGPFANIAHGCNSLIATKMALKLSDYVVTEAGFGSDLGAEKFLNIKCRELDKVPDAVVLVATIKALKYHGNESLEKGLKNLYRHYDNLKNEFGLNVIVAINKYDQDEVEDIEYLCKELENNNILFSLVDGYKLGSKGAIDIAEKLISLCENDNNFKYTYSLIDSLENKITSVATKIYGAKKVEYSDDAIKKIQKIKESKLEDYPICIAKTQYSLSDNPKLLDLNEDYNIYVKDILIKNGAKFIVVIAGSILTMPGLPIHPAFENIDIDENGNIEGIF